MKGLFQAILTRLIQHGTLSVTWPDGSTSVHGGAPGPVAAIRLRDQAAVRLLALDPSYALGEAYMDGGLEPLGCEIIDVIDVVVVNYNLPADHFIVKLYQAMRGRARRLARLNNPLHVRPKVAHHYQMGGAFYHYVLDADRQYSCGYFETGDETLDQAQVARKRLVGRKLCLTQADMSVLEIGCGWGGLGLTLGKEFGACYFGVSHSTEQLIFAREMAERAGLSHRVRYGLGDYRSIEAQFDRVVSIGSLEHVGVVNYDLFYSMVRKYLVADGVALIQHNGRSAGPGASNAWTQKYINPTGYAPALSEELPAIEKGGLMVTDIEVLRLHFARTISHWRARFAENRAHIAAMYDERFCRMYEFYLAAGEIAFTRDKHEVFQIQMSPSMCALPMTRDYIYRGDWRAQRGAVAQYFAELQVK